MQLGVLYNNTDIDGVQAGADGTAKTWEECKASCAKSTPCNAFVFDNRSSCPEGACCWHKGLPLKPIWTPGRLAMLLRLPLQTPGWHGPIDGTYSDAQCPNVGCHTWKGINQSEVAKQLQALCDSKKGCTAFNVGGGGGCLRGCLPDRLIRYNVTGGGCCSYFRIGPPKEALKSDDSHADGSQEAAAKTQVLEWSGPDVKIADVNGSAVWTIDGKVQTPQYFKITLTQGYRPPPTGNRTQLDYELHLAAAAGLPVIAFELNFRNMSKWGRSEPGTDWAFDEGRPLDAATKSEFDYILAAVPHALLWPVIDAWLPGPANSNNHPDYAVPGLENLVLRNLSGNPSVTDTFNFNVSPNEAYIMQAEAQLKGYMRLIDKLYPRKIFGVQVNNLETTEWFLPGAWDAQGSVHTFGTQYADYSNTTAIEFCGEVGCLPSPLERDTGAGSSNVFSSNRSAAFNYYLSARSARAFTRLARAAKNVSGGKAFVGSY